MGSSAGGGTNPSIAAEIARTIETANIHHPATVHLLRAGKKQSTTKNALRVSSPLKAEHGFLGRFPLQPRLPNQYSR